MRILFLIEISVSSFPTSRPVDIMRIYNRSDSKQVSNSDEKFIVRDTDAFLGLHESNSNLKLRLALIAASVYLLLSL